VARWAGVALTRRGRGRHRRPDPAEEVPVDQDHVHRLHGMPAHATAIGTAILAALPPDRREALLPPEPYPAHTANTITTRRDLARELTSVCSRGYAVDNREEIGAACLAAPVLGSDGLPLGAISVSGLAARLPERDRPELGGLVARWCGDISAQLGFRPLSPFAQEEGTGA
jgi:DNA-binding IclR family transcriptional regulator